MHSSGLLFLRWSLRDLRARWPQVTALAIVIGIGSGSYAGLTGTSAWRTNTNNRGFERLNYHGVRVEMATGTSAPEGAVKAIVERVDGVTRVEERFHARTLFSFGNLVVRGIVVGSDPTNGVDRVHLTKGVSRPGSLVLDQKFATAQHLATSGTVGLSGNATVAWSGLGLQPEYFVIRPNGGAFTAQGEFAVAYTDRSTAQRLVGGQGRVDDAVVTLQSGVDVSDFAARLRRTIATADPPLALTVTRGDQEESYHVLYQDIESDRTFWSIIAFMVLAGAAVAAFNLVTRMGEAQRRELGVGMALGVSSWRLGLRPLLMALEVALIGLVVGAGVGIVEGRALRDLFVSLLPMPQWITPFPWATYAKAASLAVVIPVVAAAWPVWRAVRCEPIDAIRSTAPVKRAPWIGAILRGVRLPWGSSLAQLPLRRAFRSPRRTLLTATGIAASIAVLVATLGMVDSMLATIELGRTEMVGTQPDRVTVNLDRVRPLDDPEVTHLMTLPIVAAAQATLSLPAQVRATSSDVKTSPIDILVEISDLHHGLWRPTIEAPPSLPLNGPGLVLSTKAARDLDVHPGDHVTVRHPRRVGTAFEFTETVFTVAGLHRNPLRAMTYVDSDNISVFNMKGLTNELQLLPIATAHDSDIRRAALGSSAVSGVQSVTRTIQVFKQTVDTYLGIFRVIEVAVALLVLLIAFNTSRIGVDETAREHATMFAFGVRPPAVIASLSAEALVSGVIGTAIGVLLGRVLTSWMATDLFAKTIPSIGLVVSVSATTVVIACALGIVTVSAAPLLSARRLLGMNVPSTLRVVE